MILLSSGELLIQEWPNPALGPNDRFIWAAKVLITSNDKLNKRVFFINNTFDSAYTTKKLSQCNILFLNYKNVQSFTHGISSSFFKYLNFNVGDFCPEAFILLSNLSSPAVINIKEVFGGMLPSFSANISNSYSIPWTAVIKNTRGLSDNLFLCNKRFLFKKIETVSPST